MKHRSLLWAAYIGIGIISKCLIVMCATLLAVFVIKWSEVGNDFRIFGGLLLVVGLIALFALTFPQVAVKDLIDDKEYS